MQHHFNTEIAEKFGVNVAIFLDHMVFWITTNMANERHFHDGYYWTRNTLEAYQKIFTYLSVKQIRKVLSDCEKNDLIKIGNYNKTQYDRTGWYALTEKSAKLLNISILPKGQMDCDKRANRSLQKGTTIPVTNTVTNTVTKNTCAIDQEKNFMSFYDAYPKKRNKQEAIKAWKKIDQSLLPLILDDIHNRVKNDINWQTKKYMPDPASYLKGKRWEDEIIYKSYHKEVKNNAPHKETSTARLNRLVGLPTKIATEDNGSTITLDQDSFCQI